MKLRLTFPFHSRSRLCGKARGRLRAFTLIEVLVSTTILAVMVGMFGTMIMSVGQMWQDAQKRVNNFTKARAMLDLMAEDIQAGVFRSDLTEFPTPSKPTFYTQRPSVGANSRDLSLVGYALTDSTLQRSSQAVAWTDPVNALTPDTTLSLADTATGVVDFKMIFLQNDGTLSSTYNTNTRAIGITLAVVDDQTIKSLSQGNKATTLYNALEAQTSMTRSVKADWQTYLNSGAMNWNAYPKSLGVGLKIFERYVYLPSSS